MSAAPRRVVRDWSGRRHTVAQVSTIHPAYGQLLRGTVRPVPTSGGYQMSWLVTDQDGHDLGEHTGNYVDAELVLLDGTGWADEPAVSR